MEYTIDRNLEDFQAWAGGKATLEVLIEKGDCETVENYITECFSHPTDTDINDFLWFSRDEIAEYLGYEDWDAYENGDQTYKDINGVELAVSDEVHWDDEAGYDENGDPITFTIVEERGDGYFNLANEGEENPERWAHYTELEIV
jgi:hypothetical protein